MSKEKTSSVLCVFHDQATNVYINGLPWGTVDERTGVFQKNKVNGADGLPKETEIQSLGACYAGSKVFESEKEAFARLFKAANISFGQSQSFDLRDRVIEDLINERDRAEEVADSLAALVLGEEIDWHDHAAKWKEAIEKAKFNQINKI